MSKLSIQLNKSFLRFILATIVIICILMMLIYTYYNWSRNSDIQNTDNAYVKGDLMYVSSKVSGYVDHVYVGDNQYVKAGQVLAQINQVDFNTLVEEAQSKLDQLNANIHQIDEQIKLAKEQVKVKQAEIEAAKASKLRADNYFTRSDQLVQDGAISKQEFDAAYDEKVSQASKVHIAMISIDEALQNINVLDAQKGSLQAMLPAAKANLVQAKENLESTKLIAPRDGKVVSRKVHQGEYLTSGKNIIVLAPVKNLWIEANLKETQISKIHSGNMVSFTIDAIPNKEFCGSIDSIANASGSELSLLPPDNASGNFTKVVRRFPVKISFSENQPGLESIAIGMSAIVNLYSNSKKCA